MKMQSLRDVTVPIERVNDAVSVINSLIQTEDEKIKKVEQKVFLVKNY